MIYMYIYFAIALFFTGFLYWSDRKAKEFPSGFKVFGGVIWPLAVLFFIIVVIDLAREDMRRKRAEKEDGKPWDLNN